MSDVVINGSSTFQRKLKYKRRIRQNFEVKSNAGRTFFEKVADYMTSHLGSLTFFIINFVWFTAWVLINTGLIPFVSPFDPFPFGLLTMTVSLEAIFLAIIVLISQNRAAKIDDLREEIELQINTIAEEEITKIMELQVLLLKKNGIDVSKDPELMQMLEPMDTNRIERLLKKQFDNSNI